MAETSAQATTHASYRPARINVIGMGISAVNMDQALGVIERAIAAGRHGYVCCAAVHSVLDAHRDPGLMQVFNRSLLTTPDGMPLVWLCRLAGYRHTRRVYGPDLLLAACAYGAQRGWRHFFVGGDPETLAKLERRVKAAVPDVIIQGGLSPSYADPEMPVIDSHAVDAIHRAQPDVVWVGLGTGKQERWMARHADTLTAPVLISVGAAFDFVAGTKRQAPSPIRRIGLEWLFRLITEPRRLWRRYIGYPELLWLLLAQVVGLRSFPIRDKPSGQDDG